MDTIKKILLIFVGDTLVMLLSWAGLSLILLCCRIFSAPQVTLIRMLSVYSFFVVMFCYAFYLVFDLCGYLSAEIRFGKMKNQMSEISTIRHLEPKLLLHLVFTRVIKIIVVCLTFTLISWLLLIQEYVWGFFLLGATLGFLVYWALSFLRRYLGYPQEKEGSGITEEIGRLTGPEEIIPKATIDD